MSNTFEKNKLYAYLGESLIEILKKYNACVAGGTITSIFCNKEINDVDIYFRNKQDAGDFIGEVIKNKDWIISHTNKATSFFCNRIVCQVIHFDYFDSPEDIFNKFDFTVCMGAFDFSQEKFILHEDFLKHNAQKILKFNENTAYPIISAMRVQKYESKGYKISKPEYIKMLLTCMNLNISTYEELKEQMGGMYGVNYDKIIEPKDDEEFNLSNIISKLSDLVLDEDYFKKPEEYTFPNNIEDLSVSISGNKIKVIKFKNDYYKFPCGCFEEVYINNIKDSDIYEEIEVDIVLQPGVKLYKYVFKEDGRYFSFYDKSFEYIINEEIKPKTNNSSSGIYCTFIENIKNATYANKDNKALLELELIDVSDILEVDNLRLSKVKVIREVTEEK